MKLLGIVLAIMMLTSVAMADELVPPFTHIRGIVDLRGETGAHPDTRVYTCNLKIKDYPELTQIKLIVADNNGNLGVSLHNSRGDWYGVVWVENSRRYGMIGYISGVGMGGKPMEPEPLTQEEAVEHANMLFKMLRQQKCLAPELLTSLENIQYIPQPQVLCCCESYYGGQCCRWMDFCGSYIPGCVCK